MSAKMRWSCPQFCPMLDPESVSAAHADGHHRHEQGGPQWTSIRKLTAHLSPTASGRPRPCFEYRIAGHAPARCHRGVARARLDRRRRLRRPRRGHTELCGRCPVVAECLAAAVASDDRAEWRGGLNRADRERLWAGLERTYRDVRDLELMRLDVSRCRAATRSSTRRPTPERAAVMIID